MGIIDACSRATKWPHKDVLTSPLLGSVNITLFGKRVFADVIQFRNLRRRDHPGLPKRTLNAITSVLVRGNREIVEAHTEGRTHKGKTGVMQL